ncbi:response regulator [Halanaerobacter jeridensis]|uniref:Stage 0 sporulation protein A homolog n=1 Tax=Halanaerobacter jeridensis TaxID=706427 RepID=A0A938XSU3_9FIRM|nr:response regulator [Halanaerobacter jeridensis]MBM7555671.1 diguanylate cyclase (GGDEF)-like protein [Halanaerobacter jeridensis]
MDEEKIEEIMQKSRSNFLNNMEDKIHNALINLLRYNYSHAPTDRKEELVKFFHSVKGTAATLGFASIAAVGEEYEEILDQDFQDSDQVILQAVEGFSSIYKNYQKLLTKDEPAKTNFTEEEKVLSDSEYTNFTTSGTILIIDDDVLLLEMLERVLREYGYEILITSEAEEGLKILEEEKIDLILLDVILPETNGFTLFKKIREFDFNEPIIFLSGRNDVDDKVKGLELGADDYITKPFDMKELKARVERVLEKHNNFKNRIIKDQLTDAYTKNYFHERAEEEKERFSRGDKRFSIAFLDLDDFKEINDNYGHLVGDEVLKNFAQFLYDNLRKIDQVYRFGGDEFLVLFPETTAKEAYHVLLRLKNNFNNDDFKSVKLEEDIRINFSSGIAEIKDTDNKIEDLLDKADQALYDVKQEDKGRVKIYSQVAEVRQDKEILIVDDEDIIVDLIRTRLNSLGYKINYSNDGRAGIELAAEKKPDLIILDLMMPKINGFEVIRQLKNNNQTHKIKIIILSSKKSDQDINRAFELGADDYLSKPFSLAELENRVKRII